MEKHRVTVALSMVYLMSLLSAGASAPTMPAGFKMTFPSMPNMTLPTISTTMPYITLIRTSTTVSSTATSTTLLGGTAKTTQAGVTTTIFHAGPTTTSAKTATTLHVEAPDTSQVPYVNATLVCGNDLDICYVETDITGDNKLECCNKTNNPACRMCLTPCVKMCQSRGEAVKYCFGSETAFACECAKGQTPTCYTTTMPIDLTTSTTRPSLIDSVSSNTTLFYVIVLIFMALVMLAVVYYVRNL
jgi:hypothetical protein